MALNAGIKLGPYEILSALGAGGMGEVYRARDTRLDRTVAVKILPAHLSSSVELKVRFQREARAISSLNHAHICHLYDIGSQNGTDYLVMEYLEGETLAQRLRKGAIPIKQALQFGVQIAEALETAHRASILHRDLKPGNVMLTPSGAKLMDFGLAKVVPVFGTMKATGAHTPSPTLSLAALSSPLNTLTEQGTLVGTYQYIAPEVLQGTEADARSDIFSLGCVLYEMVTGQRAFDGKSKLSVLTAILEKDPEPPSRLQPTSPPVLDHVIKTCLEKDPEQRFQTAHDVKLELRWIAGNDRLEVSGPARHRLRPGWVATGIAVLVAIAFATAYLMLRPRPAPVVRASILPPPGTAFLTASVWASPPALSPDGTQLAFNARDEHGKTQLYVRQLNSLEAQPLPGTDEGRFPFWSPDGREIGFIVHGKLKKVDAGGGPSQTLCDCEGFGGTWSKTGVIVIEAGPFTGLLQVPAAGGVAQPASKLDTTRGENSHRWPFFLPDGRHFLFWARSSQGVERNALYVGTLGSLQAKLLTASESMAMYASGYLLYMRGQTLMARPFDVRRLEFSGEGVPVTEHVAVSGATNRAMFSTSNNGALIYETGEGVGEWSLQWFDSDGKQVGSVAQPDHYLWPTLSPDGKRLAVVIFSGVQGTGDVWIFDLAQGTRTRLTFSSAFQRYPVWSADGKTIYYASNQKGSLHIYARASDGSGPERAVLETNGMSEYPTSVSPDGHYLVYVSEFLSGSQPISMVWALPLTAGGKPFQIVQAGSGEVAPAISPDGRWLAYQSNESGRFELYVTSFPRGGAKWQVSTNGGMAGKWPRDGKELFFLEGGGTLMSADANISGNAPQFGASRPLFHVEPNLNGPYDVTKDGKRFLVNSWSQKESGQPATLVLNWPAELKK
jgi:eukaryotic-like serine/threonine-protein kinase